MSVVTDVLYEFSKARTRLLSRLPFFGYLSMQMKPRLARTEDRVPTMGIAPDGTVVVNEDFAAKLTPQEMAGVVAHEVMHPALHFWARKGPRNHLLFNCFPAGTMIGGAERPIESIDTSATVLTASGRVSPRERMSAPSGSDMIKIEAMGMLPVEATADHKILVVRRRNGLKTYPIKLGEPEMLRAEEIDPRRDYLVMPRAKGDTEIAAFETAGFTGTNRWGGRSNRRVLWNDIFPINIETAWMLGLYTADGFSSGENVAKWTLNRHDRATIKRLTAVIASLGFSPQLTDRSDVGAVDVGVGSPILRRLFRHLMGADSYSKRIPSEILYHADPSIVDAFLAGYNAGDGCMSGSADVPVQTSATVSTALVLQLQLLYARRGVLAKIYREHQPERRIRDAILPPSDIWNIVVHEGRSFPKQTAYGVIDSRTARWKTTDDFIFTPVKSVSRRPTTETVYNIATPDHTYVANNAIVSNCAHDLSFNFIIVEMAKSEIELPKGALLDPKFQGMSAEEIYAYLLHGDPKTPGKTRIECKGGGHIIVDVNGGGGEDYEDCRGDLADSPDGQKAAKGDQGAQRKLEGEWKLAIASAAQQHEARKTQGKLPAGLKRFIDQLLHPKLDWSEQLARWVGENGRREEYGYSRPNRRSESVGTYLPSFCAGGFADITILLDTSGSIDQTRLKRAVSEIQGVCDEMGAEIRVIVIDADIHEDLTVEDAMEVAKKAKGGGGSDFCPAFDRLDEEGSNCAVIAFTDGMISVPDQMPLGIKGVLWVLEEGEKEPTEAYGDVIHIPAEDDDDTRQYSNNDNSGGSDEGSDDDDDEA